jgi:DNA-binding beta-propeller fold protein YncE
LVADKSDKLWVLSDGGFDNSSEVPREPSLSRIDPQTLTIEQIFRFEKSMWPSSLNINGAGDTLYFINGGVYKMAVTDRNLPSSPFISNESGQFYSMSVNPQNGEVYIADAIDYSQNALIMRYSTSGKLTDSFKAGINPSDFLFR